MALYTFQYGTCTALYSHLRHVISHFSLIFVHILSQHTVAHHVPWSNDVEVEREWLREKLLNERLECENLQRNENWILSSNGATLKENVIYMMQDHLSKKKMVRISLNICCISKEKYVLRCVNSEHSEKWTVIFSCRIGIMWQVNGHNCTCRPVSNVQIVYRMYLNEGCSAFGKISVSFCHDLHMN